MPTHRVSIADAVMFPFFLALLVGALPHPAMGQVDISVRMVDQVDSSNSSGQPYHGIVTKAVNAGNGVNIPAGSTAMITLVHGQSGWVAQIQQVTVNGQLIGVSSGPASLTNSAQNTLSNAMNTASTTLGSIGFGHRRPNAPSGAAAIASGQRVFLPPGTQLRFSLNSASPIGAAMPTPSGAANANLPHPGGLTGSPSAGSFATSGNLTANIVETVLGPKATSFVVSPDGGHYAAGAMHGSREIVVIDGVNGPDFDHATSLNGGRALDVAFSADGKHSAYVAQRGDDLVMVRDNKESFVIVNIGPKHFLGLSPINQSGKHGWEIGGPRNREVDHQCIISPSGAHVAVISVDNSSNPGVQTMWLDGVKGTPYLRIDPKQVAFVGEKLVYVAQTNDEKFHMVVNDKPGPAYDPIMYLTLTYDDLHYAYVATAGRNQQVVVDGVPGTARPRSGNGILYLTLAANGRCGYVWDKSIDHGASAQALVVDDKEISEDIQPFVTDDKRLSSNSIIFVLFSPDGKRFAYSKRVPGGAAAVIDGSVGRAYDSISLIAYSPDSRHTVYVGQKQLLSFPVIDGNEMNGVNGVSGFVFSPVGGRYGYPTHESDGFHMVIDGKESPRYYQPVNDTLTFSPDGKHYAYAAFSDLMTQDVIIDGTSVTHTGGIGQFTTRGTPRYTFPSLIYSPDSTRLAFAKQTRDTPLTWLINGEEFARGQTWEFPNFSPDSKHFTAFGWANNAYVLVADGKAGPTYNEIIETQLNCAHFEGPGLYRFLAVKGGSVYRVTVDLGG